MPEQLPDFGKRCAGTEQLAGSGMAEPVRMDHPEARPASRRGDDLAHPAGAETMMGGAVTHEDRPFDGRGRARTPHVDGDGFADVNRQGQRFHLLPFPTNPDRAGSPLDVLERERGKLPRTQTEPNQHDQDGIVASSQSGTSITGRNERVHRRRRETFGQAGQSPCGDRGDDSGQ